MRLLIITLLILPLSACETWNGVTSETASWFKSKPEATCLPVLAPSEIASTSVATGENPMDLRANTTLTVGDVECEVTADSGLRQTVTLKLSANKGPALKDNTLPAPFFAAVVNSAGDITSKKLYRTTFDFGSELKAEEEVVLVFNITADQSKNANIYAGFSDSVPAKF